MGVYEGPSRALIRLSRALLSFDRALIGRYYALARLGPDGVGTSLRSTCLSFGSRRPDFFASGLRCGTHPAGGFEGGGNLKSPDGISRHGA